MEEFTKEEQEQINEIITKSLEEARAYEFSDEEIFAKAAEMGSKQPEEGQVAPPKNLKMNSKKGGVHDKETRS